MHDKFDRYYFEFDKIKREFKDFKKHLDTFDRKFSATSSDLINIRVNSLTTELAALKQQLTNTQTSPSTSDTICTPIHHRLADQDDHIDQIDSDHQLIIDSLNTLHTKITDDSNEPAANHVPLTNLTTSVVRTKEDIVNINHRVTTLCARKKEFQ